MLSASAKDKQCWAKAMLAFMYVDSITPITTHVVPQRKQLEFVAQRRCVANSSAPLQGDMTLICMFGVPNGS